MEMASVFGMVWSLFVLGFLYSDAIRIPSFCFPVSEIFSDYSNQDSNFQVEFFHLFQLLLYILIFAFMFNPTKTLRHEARFWTLRVLGRIMCSPLFYVTFADFWLADQLNSLHTVFLDLHYFICYYTNKSFNWSTVADDAELCVTQRSFIRPLVAFLPAWFRFAQCLRRYKDMKEIHPHMINAAKYAFSFFVVLFSYYYFATSSEWLQNSIITLILNNTIKFYFYLTENYLIASENPYLYLWLLAGAISSGFAYTWDVKFDWGLFDKNAGENMFLREEIVYSSSVRKYFIHWEKSILLTFQLLQNYYYFGMIEDFILRVAWLITFSLADMGFEYADVMISIVSILEVFRWVLSLWTNNYWNHCSAVF